MDDLQCKITTDQQICVTKHFVYPITAVRKRGVGELSTEPQAENPANISEIKTENR
jgi:hypothetical protein